ncbi:hypothetical protein CCACVL1_02313, partial [Corchorus capsularis]
MAPVAQPKLKFAKILVRADLLPGAWLNPGQNFLESCGLDTTQDCSFRLKGRRRSFAVGLERRGNTLQFSHGWNVFARESCLKKGDKCSLRFLGRDSQGVVKILVKRTPKHMLPSTENAAPVVVLREGAWKEAGKEATS